MSVVSRRTSINHRLPQKNQQSSLKGIGRRSSSSCPTTTYRFGFQLRVYFVHSRVEPPERAYVLLVLPRHLFRFAPLCLERWVESQIGDEYWPTEKICLNETRSRVVGGPWWGAGGLRKSHQVRRVGTHAHGPGEGVTRLARGGKCLGTRRRSDQKSKHG